jgi:hypothetical protein
LKCEPKLSAGDPGSGNLLIQGDNLVALKALLPYYAGQVKCIYIDPPYNTGNEGWIYNDAVNSPEIREWLNKQVKGEDEDLTRHDKWLRSLDARFVLAGVKGVVWPAQDGDTFSGYLGKIIETRLQYLSSPRTALIRKAHHCPISQHACWPERIVEAEADWH